LLHPQLIGAIAIERGKARPGLIGQLAQRSEQCALPEQRRVRAVIDAEQAQAGALRGRRLRLPAQDLLRVKSIAGELRRSRLISERQSTERLIIKSAMDRLRHLM